MNEFASQPPSKKREPLGKFFRGGMQPAAPQDVAALIVIDIRSLKLKNEEGAELERALRDFIIGQLEKRRNLDDRSAIDLSGSVFGIAIE